MPHINSKLSSWKKNYYSLSGILSRSGIGFNVKGNHKIDCEDETWEQIIKADPNARQMRYKSWPYFDEWKEIYGKDRATGETAEDILNAWNDIRSTEDKTDDGVMGMDFDVHLEDLDENEGAAESMSNAQRESATTTVKRKKHKGSDDISGVCDILVEIGRKADERLASLADSLGYEARLGKVLDDAFEQLGLIQNLSIEERFEVCRILGAQVDKLKIFKGMPDAARPQYVAWLLKNYKK